MPKPASRLKDPDDLATLIRGGFIVTCDARDRVIEGDLLVEGSSIALVGRCSIRPDKWTKPLRVMDASGCAVVPGLVQAHVHLCQTLMRGMADDLPLLQWLKERVWPLEAAHSEESLRASAELGLIELTLAGTTTLLDMGTTHGHDAIMDACVRGGVRALSGKAMMDSGDGVPRRLRETMRSSLMESDRLCKAWKGKGNGRIAYAYAPRFVLSTSEALVRGVVDRANENGSLIHTHASEHPDELAAVRKAFGASDIAVLRRWGVFGPRAILAHGVQLGSREMAQLARDGTRLVHCPSANLKLASGIAKISKLDEYGVALALGADGAACNNNLDPWVELRHAALLAKIQGGAAAFSARRAFRLATIDGARAVGLDGMTGSLEVGKRADLAVVRICGPHAEPGGDIFSKLVYACSSRDVVSVMVDGEWIVKEGEHQRFDVDETVARARVLGGALTRRAGL